MKETCLYCGMRLDRQIMLALFAELGCRVTPSPTVCGKSPNGEHDFRDAAAEVERIAGLDLGEAE